MRDIFNSDNRIMRALGKLFDIGYLSIVFILFCIPVVTIGAALTALYYTTVKVVRRERGYVFHEFWHSFKSNFKQATFMWLIELVLLVVTGYNISLVYEATGTTSGYLLGAYLVIGIIIIAIGSYAYPILSRFEMKNTAIIRMSLFVMAKHIYFTIPIVIVVVGASLAIVLLMPYVPLVPIILPGLASLLCSFMMEIVLKKYMPKDGDESAWYNE